MPDNGTSQAKSIQSLTQQCCRDFFGHYGAVPEWVVAAPGRVNLIGEHTDYNDGFVLPMAIERFVVIAGRNIANAKRARLCIASASLQSIVEIPYDNYPVPGDPQWANYPRGVVAGFLDRGIRPPSIDSWMVSNVPLGGGLSSSAAVEVAVATLLGLASNVALEKQEIARLCRMAEHHFANVPCGIMDQLVSVLGDERGALLIDCRAETARVIPLTNRDVSILITNTNVRHSLASGEYGLRRQQCGSAARKLGLKSLRDASLSMLDDKANDLDGTERRRARHVITENERTVIAAEALAEGDMRALGSLMYQSHASLRDDYEVSCAELDALVESSHRIGERLGVFGARMTGGGFGGCTVTIVRTDCVNDVMARLREEYLEKTGRTLTGFVSRPARGAHQVNINEWISCHKGTRT